MSIRLRNGVYQVDIITAGGKRIRRSTGTANKIEAQEFHDKIKYELWRVERLGEKPNRSWDEAAVRWIKEMSHKKSIESDICKIRILTKFRGMLLNDMSRDFVMNVVESLEVKSSTKNRYLSLIKAIFKKCAGEWEWIDKAPTLTSYKEPTKRIRWITQEEARTLFSKLPDYMAKLSLFGLATGLRQSNVLNLEWSQVDIDRKVAWIHADQAKGGAAIGVPLNETAISVLEAQKGQHPVLVFTRNGNRIPYIGRKVWARALRESGIEDFRWHDLRHTWASWMVQAGVPLYDLQELGGWKSVEMVQRYAHLSPDHLHKHTKHSNLMNVTNPSHEKNTLVLLPKAS